jgi:hypothetical protein
MYLSLEAAASPVASYFLARGDTMPYLIEPIISLNEINVTYGVQGSGKSHVLFQWVACSMEGKPFFGYPTTKTTFAYCCYDRSKAKTGELMDKFGIRDKIPWFSFRNLDDPDQKEPHPLSSLPQEFPDARVIIVDGLGLLIPKGKGNDYQHVGSFLRYAGGVCDKHNITFMFTMHTRKLEGENGLLNLRQAVIGSTIFGGMAEGMIHVDNYDHKNLEDPRRWINFLPHDAKPRKILVQFNKDSWFEELDMENIAKVKMAWFIALPDVEFMRADALQVGDRYSLAESTVEKYLREYVGDGELSHVNKGPYKKIRPA